jgi:putative inorganic carbon (HCO3(-)) transporter
MFLVIGGIVVLVTLVHPQFGALLIVPAVPFGSLRQVGVGAMNVGATEVLVVLVLAAWLMRMVVRREIRLGVPPWALWLIVFLGVLCLSLVGTTSLSHSVKEILKWVEVLVLYLLVVQEMDERWTRALLVVLLGTGALVALHGIYQFLFQVGPEGFVLFDRFMRAYGTFEQPNPYGGYLGLTLPLALGLGVASVQSVDGKVKWRWLIWAGGCGGLMLTALVMSWSRGAWLGFAGAVAVMVIAVVVRSGRAAVLGTVFAVLVLYTSLVWGLARVPPSIVQRFSDFVPYLGVLDVEGREITDANFAVLERVAHWQAAWDMWTDHPWLGVGIGNFEPIYPHYALPLWPLPLGHAHNYYLNIAAEAGALGLLAYLLLWSAAVVGAWQATRQANGWRWGVALGVLGVLVHLSIHSLVDNLFVHGMYVQLAILMGIVSAFSRRSGNIDSTHHSD